MAPAEAAVQAALGVLSRYEHTCYHPQLLFKSISFAYGQCAGRLALTYQHNFTFLSSHTA